LVGIWRRRRLGQAGDTRAKASEQMTAFFMKLLATAAACHDTLSSARQENFHDGWKLSRAASFCIFVHAWRGSAMARMAPAGI